MSRNPPICRTRTSGTGVAFTAAQEDDMPATILSDALLARFAERAPGYDRENRFFTEDFADMKQAGYLTCAVPSELGGGGLTFAEVMQEQRRLAYHAHATALGINMHLYWTGIAADLWRSGDKSLEWLLTGAVQG